MHQAAVAIVGRPGDPLLAATTALRAVLDPQDTLSPGAFAVAPC
jgi:hypothetical protein